MYWLVSSLFFVLVGAVTIEWHRLRELIPAALTGILFTGMCGAFPFLSARGQYTGSEPVTDQWAIILLIQTTTAPVLSAWYAQGIAAGRGFPWLRTAIFTAISTCFSLMAIHAGALESQDHLSFWAISHALLFTLTWRVHTFVNRSHHESVPSRTR